MPAGLGIDATDCPDRRLQLSFSHSLTTGVGGKSAVRVQCAVVEATDVPEHIFLHKQHPLDPYTGEQAETFLQVATPWDLATYPIDAPSESTDFPYFRRSTFDILLPSSLMLDTVRRKLEEAVRVLLDALCRLDIVDEESVVWIPAEPDDDSSSSVSL